MRNGSGRYLLDSNILVYAFDAAEPEKRSRATEVLQLIERGNTGVVSVQVLGEFYSALTDKRKLGLPPTEAAAAVVYFQQAMPVFEIYRPMVLEAIRCSATYQLGYWDSLIWATAKFNDIPVILSEDRQDGQILEGVLILNPLKPEFDLSTLS